MFQQMIISRGKSEVSRTQVGVFYLGFSFLFFEGFFWKSFYIVNVVFLKATVKLEVLLSCL